MLLLTISSCSIERPMTYAGVEAGNISSDLRIYVREFRDDARLYGYGDERLLSGIKSIQWDVLKTGVIAEYYHKKKTIKVNSDYQNKKFVLRWAVYHEIGHHLGKDHVYCEGRRIMSRSRFRGDTYTEDEWSEMVYDYFKSIEPTKR